MKSTVDRINDPACLIPPRSRAALQFLGEWIGRKNATVLVYATEKATGKPVALICAVRERAGNGRHVMPLAVIPDGDLCDLYDPPAELGFTVNDPQAQGGEVVPWNAGDGKPKDAGDSAMALQEMLLSLGMAPRDPKDVN